MSHITRVGGRKRKPAWTREVRQCKQCKTNFKPKTANQKYCKDDCSKAYWSNISNWNLPDPETATKEEILEVLNKYLKPLEDYLLKCEALKGDEAFRFFFRE